MFKQVRGVNLSFLIRIDDKGLSNVTLADIIYPLRFWYDQLYLVPLSFAILLLAWMTAGYIISLVIAMKKASKNTDRIVTALDKIADAIEHNQEQLKKNREMLEKNNGMLENNQKTLDTLANIFKQWDWTKRLWGWGR